MMNLKIANRCWSRWFFFYSANRLGGKAGIRSPNFSEEKKFGCEYCQIPFWKEHWWQFNLKAWPSGWANGN